MKTINKRRHMQTSDQVGYPVLRDLKKNPHAIIVSIFFVSLAIWWVTIYSRGLIEGSENNAFTLIYPLLSLFGGITGLFIAYKWGGWKSKLGRALLLFSIGLLAQFFGQAVYAYYIYIQGVEVPYPSFGDFGYFGSVILYLTGIIQLSRVVGVTFSMKAIAGKVQAIVIPLAMLIASYLVFLKGYEFDWTSPLTVLLDFGYPLGQAIYVSVAILTLLLSREYLGGIMKKPALFLIFALIAQYISDFTFLYQANRETWYVGGPNDFMYLVSYAIMTLGLIYIGQVFSALRNNKE